MKLTDADELKSKKEYSTERHEWIVPVAAIDGMNTAEVAQVAHGKWIDNGDYITTAYGSLNVFKCSSCNQEITLDVADSYCPNRGAKMDIK